MTDDRLEARLRSWYELESPAVGRAPDELRTAVLAIPDVHRRTLSARRAARPTTWLAVAAMLVVGTVIASALVGALRTVPKVPPAPTARLVSPSAIPSPSVVPTEVPVASPAPTTGESSLVPATGVGLGGTMLFPRAVQSATVLPDGRVLIVGGIGARGAVATAEIWDPVAQSFSAAGDLHEPRIGHAAAALPDGRVLIVGGDLDSGRPTHTAEIWEPATGTFRDLGPMPRVRGSGVRAVTLPDGHVAIFGAEACKNHLNRHADPTLPECDGTMTRVDLFDPVSETFTPAGNTFEDRTWQAAAVTTDGRVLLVGSGGLPAKRAELYDPANGTSQEMGPPSADYTGGQTLTPLDDGRVLLVGGETGSLQNDTGDVKLTARAELWDPASDRFARAGVMDTARSRHTATLLPDGRVLIIGGNGAQVKDFIDPAVASIEVWDPATQTFSDLTNLETARGAHTATLLPDGTVLVVGGWTGLDKADPMGFAADAELVAPGG